MPSASCCFLHVFLHHRKSIPNGVQMQRNFTEIFYGPEDTQWAKGLPRTASLLYKYHNIPETLGESMKFYSSRRRVQNHRIQYRHHHGGVHHFHWCLSDDS